MMKKTEIDNFIPSILKVIASENLVTADEINDTNDKPLKDLFDEKEKTEEEPKSK
jgi:hypothetical protein